MSFPPGDTAVIDNFNRADGAPDVGRPDEWDPRLFNGDASNTTIVSNQLKAGGTDDGISTATSEGDFVRIFEIPTAGSGYLLFGWGLGSIGANWRGYYAVFDGVNWACYRRDVGSATQVDTFTSLSSLSSGQRIGVKRVGSSHEVYLGSSVNWGDETPVMSFTDSTYSSGSFFWQFQNNLWVLDNWQSGELDAPTSGVTIYVDADHDDATDENTRVGASNPDTPFLTVNAACRVARAGPAFHDTVIVKPSTLGNANPSNTNDTDLYPQLDHRWTDRSEDAVGWLQGDNTGNETIIVQGDITDLAGADRWETWQNVKDADLPRIYRPMWRGLTNWKFSRIRFGYEVTDDDARTAGTGHDYSTLGSLERSTDITFEQCHHTGGVGITAWWAGDFNLHQCVVHSPLPPDGGNPGFHDGAGFATERLPNDSEGGASVGMLNVTETEWSNVRGDDALKVGGVNAGDPLYDDFDMVVDQCLFHNITEGNNPNFHTDSIQALAVPRASITSNVFIGCSTSFIASDGRNGRIEFSGNLVVAAGSPFQMQGTDELVMEHNTFFHTTALRDATLLFFTRAALPEKTLWTFRNNIIGGIYMRDSTLAAYFHADSVFENNLVLTDPGASTPFGDHLPGIPEFGNAPRLDVIPNLVFSEPGLSGDPDLTLARTWELANSPDDSPGIGDGAASTFTTDLFARAYTTPPDVGALQSTSGTSVTPTARAPYIIAKAPTVGQTGVSPTVTVYADLYPVPGASIDAATITTSSFAVRDPANTQLTTSGVNLTGPVNGTYRASIDLTNQMLPWVVYEARMTTGVADSAGTHLENAEAWTFRIAGVSPAETAPGGGGAAGGWSTTGIVADGAMYTFPVSLIRELEDGGQEPKTSVDRTVPASSTVELLPAAPGILWTGLTARIEYGSPAAAVTFSSGGVTIAETSAALLKMGLEGPGRALSVTTGAGSETRIFLTYGSLEA